MCWFRGCELEGQVVVVVVMWIGVRVGRKIICPVVVGGVTCVRIGDKVKCPVVVVVRCRDVGVVGKAGTHPVVAVFTCLDVGVGEREIRTLLLKL